MSRGGATGIVGAVLILSGCDSVAPNSGTSISPLITQQTSDVGREVADASLYRDVLEPVAVETLKLVPDHITDEVLLNVINAEFTGKLEDLVSLVARETGYRVVAEGEKPGSPILIILVRQNLPVVGLLREGSNQARGRARVTVDQNRRLMIIHYVRPERSPVPHVEDLEP